jgi:hypothetical protein
VNVFNPVIGAETAQESCKKPVGTQDIATARSLVDPDQLPRRGAAYHRSEGSVIGG